MTFVFVRVFFVSPCSMLHQITYDRAWGMVVEIENPVGRNLEERIIRDFSIIFLSRFYHKYTYKKQSNQSNSETNGGVKWLKKLNPHVPGQWLGFGYTFFCLKITPVSYCSLEESHFCCSFSTGTVVTLSVWLLRVRGLALKLLGQGCRNWRWVMLGSGKLC